MKILFLGYAVNESIVSGLSGSSVAGNKMQLNLIHNMAGMVEDIKVITIYPVATWPHERQKFFGRKQISLGGGVEATRVSFCNLPIVKQVSQIISVYREAREYIRENSDAVIVTSNMYPQVGIPAVWLRRKADMLVPVLADLPIDSDYKRKGIKKILRRIFDNQTKRSILKADKVVVLNKHARDIYAPDKDFLVIEGGINPGEYAVLPVPNEKTKKNIVYGGSLSEYSGVRELVDAMQYVDNRDIILEIYGRGVMEEYILKAQNERIRYCGTVTNTEMLKIQQEAWLLVNPRPVEDPIAQVTFPSKIFEYLMSGVSVLATRLNGFTKEYEDKMFFVPDNSSEKLAEAINMIDKQPPERLARMALEAKEFLLREKTWAIQAKKIVNFIERGK